MSEEATSAAGDPLTALEGVTPSMAKKFAKLEIHTLGDLLEHYPRRYEDRTGGEGFPNQPTAEAVEACGEVIDMAPRFFGGRKVFEMTVAPTGDADFMAGRIVCRWFNMSFIAKQFAVGQKVALFGIIKERSKRLVMDHPEYELLDAVEVLLNVGRIVPVYPATKGVGQRLFRKTTHAALELMQDDRVPDLLPTPSDKGPFAGMYRARAIREIHFPESDEALLRARRYLALEEFFLLQLRVLQQRAIATEKPRTPLEPEGATLAALVESLPFDPTGAQSRAIEEVATDLKSGHAMSRLLQGDVGSGKTLVAVAAILLAVEAGETAALMAPTQILAEQHYLVLRGWLEPLGIRLALRTGSRKIDSFLPLLDGVEGSAQKDPQVFVGTHALLYDKAGVENPGLVVIDEQHRFGVEQRARLIDQGGNPHVLVMTATPIPRTLTLSLYGDLDVSVLDERPGNRGEISTAVRQTTPRAEVAKFLRDQIDQGRQVYLVYPLIEESETLRIGSAEKEFPKWKKALAPAQVGLLHGRMSPEEKDSVMSRFRAGESSVLIATTVIEVGIDVPNATVMVIYHAERFGLSQLHQLRGRIGRGEHKSYCILMSGKSDPDAVAKLEILAQSNDGFRIAEADLKRRGPGEILGKAQSGISSLRLGNLVTDVGLVKTARRLANDLLEKDPHLRDPEHARLRKLLPQALPGGELQ